MTWTRRFFRSFPGTASPSRRSGRCPPTFRPATSRRATRVRGGWRGTAAGGGADPPRWGAFLSSMNELLDAVPACVRFAVENTPVDSGQVSVILDIVDRYPADRGGVCLALGQPHSGEET